MKTVREILNRITGGYKPDVTEITELLSCQGKKAELVYTTADKIRSKYHGSAIHLRGIIEFSNYCRNNCWYCGIRCDNQLVQRYRMSDQEIFDTAYNAVQWGCGTVVLQSGEDPFYVAERLADIIRTIKTKTNLAVTLSVGTRPLADLQLLKAAGADRYLLRFETTSNALFTALHPDETQENRLQCLTNLRQTGFQVGSGFMIGLPGSTLGMIANDIIFTTQLKLDMIGCGPFLPHPDTPLSGKATLHDQGIYYKTIALLRILNPQAHIPATTAFDALEPEGRNKVLQCGANVFMPNITPLKYRKLYQLYPKKSCVDDDGTNCAICISKRIANLNRGIGEGPGHSIIDLVE